MPKQYISPAEVGPTMGLYNKAIRAGNTVYVSGQVPWDASGNVVGRGDIQAQANRVFENMRTVLEAGGASMDDLVNTTTYMTNALFRGPINEARQHYGVTGVTNTSLMVTSLVQPELLLEVSAIAVVDTPKQVISPPDVHDVTGRYVHAIRAGNTIYVAGQVALDRDGNLVGPGDIEAQANQVFENMRRVLQAAGASMSDIVNTTTYLTNVLYRPAVAEVRQRLGMTEITSTLIVVPSLALPEFLIEVEAIAVVDTPRQVIVPPDVHDVTGRYVHAIRAGDTVYLSGQVAIDPAGKLVGPGNIEEQATQVFENLKRVAEAAGATLDDIVNTTTYLTSPVFRNPVNEVRKRFGLTKMTNTTLTIPSLAAPEYLLEIEAIAVVGD